MVFLLSLTWKQIKYFYCLRLIYVYVCFILCYCVLLNKNKIFSVFLDPNQLIDCIAYLLLAHQYFKPNSRLLQYDKDFNTDNDMAVLIFKAVLC